MSQHGIFQLGLALEAGLDLILVGDSTAVVSQGLDSTVAMTLNERIYRCKSVARGARRDGKAHSCLRICRLGPTVLRDGTRRKREASPYYGQAHASSLIIAYKFRDSNPAPKGSIRIHTVCFSSVLVYSTKDTTNRRADGCNAAFVN